MVGTSWLVCESRANGWHQLVDVCVSCQWLALVGWCVSLVPMVGTSWLVCESRANGWH